MYSDEERRGADDGADGQETSSEEPTAAGSRQGPSHLARAMKAGAYAQGSTTPRVGVKKRLWLFVKS